MHHSSHLLWQTAEPDDPLFADRRRVDLDRGSLVDVFRAADAAVGQIVAAAPAGARTAVFSLHGMRSASGIPTILDPLLSHLGYAATPRPGRMSPRDAGRLAFAAAKRNAPERVRTAWRRRASLPLLNAIAGPTAMRAYDWDRTRAFVLPHDQHGWVRINLAGREARGTVPAAHYAGLCDELSAALLAARDDDGRPLITRVLRVADGSGGTPPPWLPDLVLHWADTAYRPGHDGRHRHRRPARRAPADGPPQLRRVRDRGRARTARRYDRRARAASRAVGHMTNNGLCIRRPRGGPASDLGR